MQPRIPRMLEIAEEFYKRDRGVTIPRRFRTHNLYE